MVKTEIIFVFFVKSRDMLHLSFTLKWGIAVNEMNRALGHLCAHNRLNWARTTS